MSTTLTNTNISNTYVGVLHAKGTQLPPTGQEDIYDGFGNKSAIKLGRACNGMTVCGPLSCSSIDARDISPIINLIYPIGSIIFTYDNINPGVRFTNQMWEQVSQGRFIVGVGSDVDVAGNTKDFTLGPNNGEYKHQLSVEELPSHRHSLTSPAGDQYYVINDLNTTPPGEDQANGAFRSDGPEADKDARWYPWTAYVGSNIAHENTPPGFGLYVWKRLL